MTAMFDAYELRARIFPTILVLSPFLFPIISIINTLGFAFSETASILIFFVAGGYFVSFHLRFRSKKQQDKEWGESAIVPSTAILLEKDRYLGSTIKHLIREKIQKDFGIVIIPDSQNESEMIAETFRLIKPLLTSNYKLVSAHNCEYGFFRNLLGGYEHWVFFSIISMLITMVIAFFFRTPISIIAMGIAVLYALSFLWVSKKGLKTKMNKSANIYAETTWICYYHHKF